MRGFSKCLAEEFPKLKIYIVNPGLTSTRMTNFSGVGADKVAEIVLNTALEKYGMKSGDDIKVWDYYR